MRTALLAFASVVALASSALAQNTASVGNAPPPGEAVAAPKAYGAWGVDLTARNLGVKPGDGFFQYANGTWFGSAAIPADQGSTGVDYDVFNLSQVQLRALIEDSAKTPDSPTAAQIGALYKAFMDEAKAEALDDKPLQPDLAAIKAATTRDQIAELMGRSNGGFGLALFAAEVDPDDKDPTRNVLALGQAGLGLPDRDYYLTKPFETQKAAYRAYIERTLGLIGWPDAAAAADQIMALETKIAEASWPVADRRDSLKVYNPQTLAELKALAPGFPWDAYLKGAGASDVTRVIVHEKSAFPKIAEVFASTPVSVLQAWQAFHTADQASPYLSKRFVDSRFDFRGKSMSGLESNRPRWKRGVAVVDSSLGEAVGREYVARYFPPGSKAKMEALVGNLKDSMAARIGRVSWMSPQTKAQALAKLAKLRVMVGYPDKWRDYSALKITPEDLYGDVQRSAAFEWAWQIGKLKKPVDPKEWQMHPQEVNAYNDPERNVIVFPAAILQAPYFDPKADAAVNYGAIGAIIGHEITHGFDDQGRHYDATGALRDWWTKEDAARFEVETKKLASQYDALEVAPGLHVNGQLTMGENLADLGGLLMALDAYHASLGGKPAPVIDGLSGDQRLFLAFAQAWRDKQRQDAEKEQVASDPHSPSRFRAEAPERNIDAWYAAFEVTPDQKLYLAPDQRVRIW
jgi:putative endopeptidase